MAVEEIEKMGQENAENLFEIELSKNDLGLDDQSPRAVLDIAVLGSDSDNSSSSSSSSITSTPSSSSPAKSTTPKNGSSGESNYYHVLQFNKMIESIKKKSLRRFSAIPQLASHDLRRNLRKLTAKFQPSNDDLDGENFLVAKPSCRSFTYEELVAATDDFSPENLIGQGGHAEVYKGQLPDGETVAIKKLLTNEKEEELRVSDFLSELGIIAHVNHPNAAHLIGFSTDHGLHLVLEFSPHGSLASLLFGSEECLEWNIRFKVAVGVANGLRYLHHGCHRRIIHRDIKASNILLTQDYEAQISDFGLAKWLPENWRHHIVFPIEGTFGYLAPEYFMHGIVDEKTDVFAFGVLLLEIITGRQAVDTASRQSLVMWAKPLLEENNIAELVDPRLGDNFDITEMKRAMLTASMCIHHLPTTRPHMTQVIQLLKGEDGPVELQQKSDGESASILDGCDLQDYTCTSYLKDMNRHMELVME